MVEDWCRAASLDELYDAVKDCRKCPLGETRTNLVFGAGNPEADIMFVGEAPGYHEDQQGLPFVGQAGKLLDQLLKLIDLGRDEVYIANILKARPPDNRDPLPSEVEACYPYLLKQIELIRPLLICTLGNHATKNLLKTGTGITQLHGKLLRKGGQAYVPLFHPAAALHKPPLKNVLIDDFRALPGYLEEERERREKEGIDRAPEPPDMDEGQPEQMGLF